MLDNFYNYALLNLNDYIKCQTFKNINNVFLGKSQTSEPQNSFTSEQRSVNEIKSYTSHCHHHHHHHHLFAQTTQ